MSVCVVDIFEIGLWCYYNYTAIPNPDNDKRIQFGILRILTRLVSFNQINRFVFVLDDGVLEKNKTLIGYKKNRYIPSAVNDQVYDSIRSFKSIGIDTVKISNTDCFDVISSIASSENFKDECVYILSNCEILDQCLSKRVMRINPEFINKEIGDFYSYCYKGRGLSRNVIIDKLVFHGCRDCGIIGVEEMFQLALIEHKMISETVSLDDLLKKFGIFDDEKKMRKISEVRRLVTLNSDICIKLNHLKEVSCHELKKFSEMIGVSSFLYKEFVRGTAFPPTASDKNKEFYNKALVPVNNEYRAWAIRRLAEYDSSILEDIYKSSRHPYPTKRYLEKALNIVEDVDIPTEKLKFDLSLTFPELKYEEFLDISFFKQMKTTYIYGLYDPLYPEEIKYIGKSDRPQTRLRRHLKGGKDGYHPKDDWIYHLSRVGRVPRFKILEEVKYYADVQWEVREEYYIKKYSAESSIYNISPGGQVCGNKTYSWTEIDDLVENWRRDPSKENQEKLWKAQLIKVSHRIKRYGGHFCSYCQSYIPEKKGRLFDDLLPYPPLIDRNSVWKDESIKHDLGCVWWKNGYVG